MVDLEGPGKGKDKEKIMKKLLLLALVVGADVPSKYCRSTWV